ncbi:hypothetical protein XELAEV_18003523mg [Xenopus laevis]|uniref:Uncharacterized protein n=1 Tax=Xenopus laevis TaxID=8355 RepID=A0A974BN65_XENLA|nr:hypothetical protein XELAEV_18003523mg [Xenopus laevis]
MWVKHHIKIRLNEHKSVIRNFQPDIEEKTDKKRKQETTLAKHFYEYKHGVSQIRWQILERVSVKQGQDLKQKLLQLESFWIWTLQTQSPKGLNEEFNLTCFL